MGILSGIFKARDKPSNATAGSAYRFLFGGSTSGKAVTERSAMQMTAVYSCVRILAEAVAGLPLHLYRYTDTEGKEQFCGTLIKTRSKPGSKEVEEISRRLLDFSPRLKKLSGTSCQVFVRMLSSEKNKTFTPDACMQALHQLQQNAAKAKD